MNIFIKICITCLLVSSFSCASDRTTNAYNAAKELEMILKYELKTYQYNMPQATSIEKIQSYQEQINIRYIYHKKSLIRSVYEQSGLNILEATKVVNSKKFLKGIQKFQPRRWHDTFCSKPIKDYIDRGVVIYVALHWDDNTLIVDTALDKYICENNLTY